MKHNADYNILTDKLPTEIDVGEQKIPILTDFRRWILFLDLFDKCRTNNIIHFQAAARYAIKAVLPDTGFDHEISPELFPSLLEKLLSFAAGPNASSDDNKKESEPVFDFLMDAEIILAAFQKEYGLDLTVCSLHWWHFLSLLRSLPAESDFMRLIQIRLCDTTKISDDGMRRQMRRAKAAVRLKKREKSTLPDKEKNYD